MRRVNDPLSMTLLRGTDCKGLRTQSQRPVGSARKNRTQYTDLVLEVPIAYTLIRLQHTSGVDHELVRLMVWSAQQVQVRAQTHGSTWRSLDSVIDDDVLNIANRGSLAQRLQPNLTRYIEPQTVIYGGNASTDGAIPGSDLFEKPLVESERCCYFVLLPGKCFSAI